MLINWPQRDWQYIKFYVKQNLFTNAYMPLSVLSFQIRECCVTPNVYLLLDQLTSSVEKIPRESNSSSAIQDFHRCVWNPKSHYYVHKGPALQNQTYPVHELCFIPLKSTFILSTHLHLGLPSGLFPPGFYTKTLYTSLLSPRRTSNPIPLIHPDFITRITSGEECNPYKPSLCSTLQSILPRPSHTKYLP